MDFSSIVTVDTYTYRMMRPVELPTPTCISTLRNAGPPPKPKHPGDHFGLRAQGALGASRHASHPLIRRTGVVMGVESVEDDASLTLQHQDPNRRALPSQVAHSRVSLTSRRKKDPAHNRDNNRGNNLIHVII